MVGERPIFLSWRSQPPAGLSRRSLSLELIDKSRMAVEPAWSEMEGLLFPCSYRAPFCSRARLGLSFIRDSSPWVRGNSTSCGASPQGRSLSRTQENVFESSFAGPTEDKSLKKCERISWVGRRLRRSRYQRTAARPALRLRSGQEVSPYPKSLFFALASGVASGGSGPSTSLRTGGPALPSEAGFDE